MRSSEIHTRRATLSNAYLRRPNTWVSVTGTIRTFGSKKYINATQIRPVNDMLEPYHHQLHAMVVQLIFERGPVGIFS